MMRRQGKTHTASLFTSSPEDIAKNGSSKCGYKGKTIAFHCILLWVLALCIQEFAIISLMEDSGDIASPSSALESRNLMVIHDGVRANPSWSTGDPGNEPQRLHNASLGNLKVLLFITTIFSDNHVTFFSCCWPKLMKQSKLLPNVHVMIFANNNTAIPSSHIESVETLFRGNPSYQLKYAPENELKAIEEQGHKPNRFQYGANLGPKLGFQFGWFENYDWVIRINPDVLIRNSTWLLQTMLDRNVEGIFANCNGIHNRIHTDFFAVRPKSLRTYHDDNDFPFSHMELEPWSAPVNSSRKHYYNHEGTAYKYFFPMVEANKHRYLEDADDSNGRCRVRGDRSSVFHGHGSCRSDPLVCDALEGWNVN